MQVPYTKFVKGSSVYGMTRACRKSFFYDNERDMSVMDQ